ncbi:MAG: TonB-dependent receptor [Bacteroidales bacterium]|jgi:iron complex outermembrane receptor protein|nr:TonB-dependent receptor [Bacteroidales bacterium]
MKKVTFIVFFCYLPGLYAQTDSIRQVDLSEIVVSATRANHRTPTTFTNLKAVEANRIMVSPEVPGAIGFTPSVVMTSENGAAMGNQTFRVRGSDATRTNVTFDGVPLNDAESQAVFWVNMPDLMSSLQTMQIQRGVGTSANGAASFGATLNMQAVQPAAEPYGQVSAAYGSFNTFKLNVAAGTGRSKNGWNADLRCSLGRTDGYIEHSGSNQQSLFFTGGYSSSRRIVKMNVFYGDQHTDISWEGVPEDQMAVNRRYNPSGLHTGSEGSMVRYDNETDNYRQTHVHLHYTEMLSERFKLNTTLYYTRGKGYYEQYREEDRLSKYGLPAYNDGNASIAATDLIRRKWLDNDLWGAIVTATYTTGKTRAYLGVSGSYFDNRHYGDIIWAQYRQAVPAGYEWYRGAAQKPDISAYLKVTQQLGQRWYAFGDIQWRGIGYDMKGLDDDLADLTQEHHYNFFNPKIGVTFAVTSQQRAYASFAVGRREPTRTDIKDALKYGGTAMPRPETLYDAEAGYELNSQAGSLGVNVFYMYYIDQLVNTGKMNDVGYALMENVPDSYRAGIELTFGIRPVKALQMNGNIAYSRNRIKNYVAYVDAETADGVALPQREERPGTVDLAFSPEWVGAADVSYEIIKGLSIGLTAKYVGKQYYDNTSHATRRLDGYFVNNAIAYYRLDFKKFYAGLQFAVNNLWNAGYISNAAVYRGYVGDEEWVARYFFPQPFRNFMAKLTVGF